ncbi:17809_t:CDS:2, partial [Racocetra fulgida]
YSEGLTALDNQGSSVQIIQNKGEPLSTSTFQILQRIYRQEIDIKNIVELDLKKVSYGRGLRLCKKALNIVITNGSNKTLEDILQQFIDKQISGKDHSANKRYLTMIEENNSKIVV